MPKLALLETRPSAPRLGMPSDGVCVCVCDDGQLSLKRDNADKVLTFCLHWVSEAVKG